VLIIFCWKWPNCGIFSKLGFNWHIFKSGYQNDTFKWKWIPSD